MLTQERVRELLNYNQETGLVTWNISINGRAPVGSVAGYVNGRGYRIITIDNHMYPAHRLIWMWMEGYFPESEIDHISGVRDDNRWCNLRHVSTSCNRVNRERTRNIGGEITGVRHRRSSFEAYITYNSRTAYLGTWDALTEAVCHRYAAEQCLGVDSVIMDRKSSSYQYLKQQGILK